MALTDPQSVTIGTDALTLPRTGSGNFSGSFASADGATKLTISHETAKRGRTRHLAKLENKKVVSDPLIPAQSVQAAISVHTVIDTPAVGYSNADAKKVVAGHIKWLNDNSQAIVERLLGNES